MDKESLAGFIGPLTPAHWLAFAAALIAGLLAGAALQAFKIMHLKRKDKESARDIKQLLEENHDLRKELDAKSGKYVAAEIKALGKEIQSLRDDIRALGGKRELLGYAAGGEEEAAGEAEAEHSAPPSGRALWGKLRAWFSGGGE